jgi:SPP1 family predicted phage head-tail adaptor
MTLAAGRLRHRITIQRPVNTQDPLTGAITPTWENVVTDLAAEIAPLSVREFIASQSMQSQITARIVIRYRAGLDATMRILHGSKIYNPAGWLPDPDSGLEWLTAPCSEGVNDGQ